MKVEKLNTGSKNYLTMDKRVTKNWSGNPDEDKIICKTGGTGHDLKAIGIDIALINGYDESDYNYEFDIKIVVNKYDSYKDMIESYEVIVFNEESKEIWSRIIDNDSETILAQFLFIK